MRRRCVIRYVSDRIRCASDGKGEIALADRIGNKAFRQTEQATAGGGSTPVLNSNGLVVGRSS